MIPKNVTDISEDMLNKQTQDYLVFPIINTYYRMALTILFVIKLNKYEAAKTYNLHLKQRFYMLNDILVLHHVLMTQFTHSLLI